MAPTCNPSTADWETKSWGWLDYNSTALAALQDHLQIKGVGEEKGERREGRGREWKALEGKGWCSQSVGKHSFNYYFFLVLNINSKVTTTQAPL